MLALFIKVPTMKRLTKDPQFFRGFQIFCESRSPLRFRTSPLVTYVRKQTLQ